MNEPTARLRFWLPRVLGILFSVFVTSFALDVFREGLGIWPTLLALAMHLVPSAIVVVLLAIAWRWERIGGLMFICLAVLFVFIRPPHTSWIVILLIPGPLIVIGGLFLLSATGHTRVTST